MKYKVKSACGRISLHKKVEGKFDWILFYGESIGQCYQVQCLFRDVPTDKEHANCIDKDKNYLRDEQLTFQSRKAAYRYIIRNKALLQEDYKKRNGGRECGYVISWTWRGHQKPLVVKVK